MDKDWIYYYDHLKFPNTIIDVNKLKAKYKGTDKEKIMNTVFDRLDAFDAGLYPDQKNDGNYQDGNIELDWGLKKRIVDTLSLLSEDKEQIEKFLNTIGENFSYEDVENAIKDILSVGEQQVKDYQNDYPEAVKKHILSTDNKVRTIQKDGQTLYEITQLRRRYTIDSTGNILMFEHGDIFEDENDGNVIFKYLLQEGISDSKNCNLWHSKAYVIKHENGLQEIGDFRTGSYTRKFGKTSFKYHVNGEIDRGGIERWHENKTLDSITVNEGLVNQTSMNFIFDENGKISDIKFNAEKNDTITTLGERSQSIKNDFIQMSNSEKQGLIELLNSDAMIGNNYDLKVVGNKIQAIPIVKDNNGNIVENMPTAYRQDALNLMKQGFLNGQDYTLSKNNDGTFEMDMQSSAAKNYEFDQKVVTYSKDGKQKTTMMTTGNKVEKAVTINGQLVSQTTENREEALCMSLVEGRFEDANKLLGDNDYNGNDFNVYEACDKYHNLTGKNLIQELIQFHKDGKIDKYFLAKIVPSAINTNPNVMFVSKDYVDYDAVESVYNENMQAYKMLKNYKPQETQAAELLYSNTTKDIKSEKEYSQKVGSNNYVVRKENDNIIILCNGNTHTINLNGLPSEVQKAIFELNPMALYRIATTGIKIKIADRAFDKERGQFFPGTNTIEINVGNLSYTTIQKTLLHEVGHSYYTNVRQQKNELLEETFEEEYETWKNNNHKNTGDGGDYCTENIYEFVAEAYALLVSGNCGSEYTICEHFPKTLAIVRQMIEND